MKNRFIILLVSLLVLIVHGNATASGDKRLAQSLRARVVAAPDTVLTELDKIEAQKHPLLPAYQINLLRGLAYNEKRMYSLMERSARKVLADDSISYHPKEKLNALIILSQAQAFFGVYQGAIESAIEAMDLARKDNNQATEYNILTTMAEIAFRMGDRQGGYKYLDQIISGGNTSDDMRVLASVSAAYGVKVMQLYADNEYDKGLSEGHRRLALIDKIDKVGGSPAGFTDQQRAYAYARIASCAFKLKKTDEARKAYEAFMATDYARNPAGRIFIMDYLLDSGQWRTVLEFTAPLYSMYEGADTINSGYYGLLTSDGWAQAGLGNYREGYELIRRASVVQDSLYMREKTTRAQELASVFALNEKELALVNEKANSQRKQLLFIASSGIAVLILIILILVWRAYRISLKQQHAAAKRIDDLISKQPLTADATPEDQQDYALFAKMQSKIISEALFKSPTFNRDNIVEATGLSRGKVTQLINQFAGLTPNEYINKLRVEYSVKIIKEHPEWTIDAIAESCGYVRRATYYSHFNKLFGISPAQYRKERCKPGAEIKMES